MNFTLVMAINEHRRVTFQYDGEVLLATPATYGVTTAGHDALRAYSDNKGWQLVRTEDMVDLALADQSFEGFPPNFSRNDKDMARIYSQL